MCGLDVDVGAWLKHQKKSPVSLAEEWEEFAFHQSICYGPCRRRTKAEPDLG